MGYTGKCWCSDSDKAWFADESDGLDETCGGTGVLYCHCGGDQCACHNHGEVECGGCEDCEEIEEEGAIVGV